MQRVQQPSRTRSMTFEITWKSVFEEPAKDTCSKYLAEIMVYRSSETKAKIAICFAFVSRKILCWTKSFYMKTIVVGKWSIMPLSGKLYEKWEEYNLPLFGFFHIKIFP